jgi:hypothetical protein
MSIPVNWWMSISGRHKNKSYELANSNGKVGVHVAVCRAFTRFGNWLCCRAGLPASATANRGAVYFRAGAKCNARRGWTNTTL